MSDYEPYAPEKPKGRTDAEKKELARLTSSIAVIQDVLDWFEKQISDYTSPSTITGVTPTTNAEDVKFAVMLAQKLAGDYEAKAQVFRNEFAPYIKKGGKK